MANYRDMAKVHARRKHTCELCGQVVRGNGGRASHRRKHIREAGIDPNDHIYGSFRKAWHEALKRLRSRYL